MHGPGWPGGVTSRKLTNFFEFTSLEMGQLAKFYRGIPCWPSAIFAHRLRGYFSRRLRQCNRALCKNRWRPLHDGRGTAQTIIPHVLAMRLASVVQGYKRQPPR